MNRFVFLAVAAFAGAAGAADNEGLVEEQVSNPWHFRIGPVMAPRVRVKVSGPRFAMPVIPANGSKSYGFSDVQLPADKTQGAVNRTYDDGSVSPDSGTDEHGNTWFWKADNLPEQYSHADSADSTMQFHTKMTRWEDTYSTRSFQGGSRSESDREILLGLEAMGGWTFYDDKVFDAALDFGFRYYGSDDLSARSRYGTSVSTTREEFRQVDTYKVNEDDTWQAFPNVGYEGKQRGIGPVIPGTPDSQDEESMGTRILPTEEHYYSSSTKFDYHIWDLRLGPTMGWKATDYLMIRGGVYGLLGLVDARLRTDVRSDQGNVHARKSTCDALFGMAFSFSAELSLTDSIFLFGSAEYDWWTDSVSLRTGGAKACLDLSDFTVSAGLGIEF